MAQSEMSELREIARMHYETASPEVQVRAVEFFKSMDADGDGQVNIHELWSFMSEHGHPAHFSNHRFFSLLDTDGSGGLSFDEVKTLFYIIASGRPFCAWCAQFIAGVFFSCSDCPFLLCPKCFQDAQGRNHFHDGRCARFLDTFAFLQTLRSHQQQQRPKPTPSPDTANPLAAKVVSMWQEETANSLTSQRRDIPSTSQRSANPISTSQRSANPSTSVLVHQRTSKREATYKALTLALAAASINDCPIL